MQDLFRPDPIMFGLVETGYMRGVTIAGTRVHGKDTGKAAPGNQDIGKTAIRVIDGTREAGNNGVI